MRRYTEIIEPLSLDEAYLDVTGQDAIAIGRDLKAAVLRETRLTASVGVSYCKFLAKLGSDMDKPNGLTVIDWDRAQQMLPGMPVRKLWGVGPASEQALGKLGIVTCADLLRHDPEVLRRHYGRRADELILLASGIDFRGIEANHEMKSVGEETTFPHDQTDRAYLGGLLEQMAGRLAQELTQSNMASRTVTVKIKWNVFIEGGSKGGDFLQNTRSYTVPMPTADPAEIGRVAREIFSRVEWEGRKIRLLGLQLHNFVQRGDVVQTRLPI
jgi:DNA polymerase-4